MSGWNLLKPENWKERLAEMQKNRPGSKPPYKGTLKLPVIECDPDCLICKGNTFYVDGQEHAIECPNARRKLDGGD